MIRFGSVGSGIEAASVAWEPRGWKAAWLSEIERGQPGLTVVWENVPGVLSTKDNAFGCFLAALVGADATLVPPGGQRWTDAGLVAGPRRSAAWRVLDAQYFGLAQRRERVFVVASPRNGADPSEILFEPEGVRRHFAPRRSEGPAVAALTANGVGTCGADGNQGQAGHLIAQAFGGGNTGGGIEVSTALTAHAGRYDFDTETVICHEVAPYLSASYAKQPDNSDTNAGPLLAINRIGVRRLLPTECEALQGFPRNYTAVPYRGKPASDGPRYKALGNSMAVPCMHWLGRRIEMHRLV